MSDKITEVATISFAILLWLYFLDLLDERWQQGVAVGWFCLLGILYIVL